VHEADMSFFIYYRESRHTAAFKQLDFLSEQLGDDVLGVGDADERHIVFMPPVGKFPGAFRTDSDDFSIESDEFLIVLAQPRHVFSTVGSEETPVKGQNDIFLSMVIGQTYKAPLTVGSREIRRCRSVFLSDHSYQNYYLTVFTGLAGHIPFPEEIKSDKYKKYDIH
jgi:hypothetical protein